MLRLLSVPGHHLYACSSTFTRTPGSRVCYLQTELPGMHIQAHAQTMTGTWLHGSKCASHLGCVHCHAEALGPVHLLSKCWISACFPEHIRQGSPGTEFSDNTDWAKAQPHEQHNIRVPHCCHDGRLHTATQLVTAAHRVCNWPGLSFLAI